MTRSTWILVVILLLLVVAVVVVLRLPGEYSVSPGEGDLLFTYDSVSVDRIDIVAPTGNIELRKEGSGWMLTAPLRAPADIRGVEAAVGKGKSIKLSSLISSNPQKQELFQVDSTGTLVRIYGAGAERAAFWIGKPGSPATDTYVRREGDTDVFLAEGMLGHFFSKPVRDWRDKAILSLTPEAIHSVRFHYGDTTFTLSMQDTVWRVDDAPVKDDVVRSFLSSLATLQCDEFIDTPLPAIPPLLGVLDVDGVQLGFHLTPGNTMVTVITSRNTQVYEMYTWRAEQVLKRKKDFVAGQ